MNQALEIPFGRALSRRATRWPRGEERSRRSAESLEPDVWERAGEPYTGAIVLEDLAKVVGDAAAAERILARFAALRFVLVVVDGRLSKRALAAERGIAKTYLDELPAGDPERRALGRMVALAAWRLRRGVAICALEAGAQAARLGHIAGAYWLNHTAYTLSLKHGWAAEALRAATAIEGAALAGGAPKAARRWRRRALAIERALA